MASFSRIMQKSLKERCCLHHTKENHSLITYLEAFLYISSVCSSHHTKLDLLTIQQLPFLVPTQPWCDSVSGAELNHNEMANTERLNNVCCLAYITYTHVAKEKRSNRLSCHPLYIFYLP